jgi:glycosyltransferase involved in cell wall biosynthesis
MARLLVAANSTWNLENFRAGLIRQLLRTGYQVTTLSPDPLGIAVDKKAVPHRVWRMERSSIDPRKNMASVLTMIRIIREEKPDAFLGFTIKPNIYGCIACRLLKVPSILNVSGLGSSFMSGSAFRRAILVLYRLAFAKADSVFFQNPDDAKLFIDQHVVRAGQAYVLPGSGINLAKFTPTDLPLEPKFLMVARLLADKGVREYVAAARQVKGSVPAASFALLGELDHHNRRSIGEGELNQWVSEGVVKYLGATKDVRPFIREASAVVLPSYREGLPRTLLEGAAMGRPLIGTDVPGCREVIRDEVTGYLCDPRSAESLAAALERFATSSYSEREAMARNARAMVEQEFDERLVFEAYRRQIGNLIPSTRD